MSENRRQLLTIGAFFIAVVVAFMLYATSVIDWTLIAPVVLVVFGIWLLALSTWRGANPQKYERGAFSTLSMGLLLIVIGGAWSMLAFGFNWVYSLILILLVIAVLVIALALMRK